MGRSIDSRSFNRKTMQAISCQVASGSNTVLFDGVTLPARCLLSLRSLCAFVLLFVFALQCAIPSSALAWGSFTYKDEIELGKKFNVLVRSRMPIIQDPEVTEYMTYLINRLTKTMPRQPFEFTPAMVISPSLNAFATPGGYVFAYTGLVLALENESDLAGVMAHELAHVTQRHIAGRIENAQLWNVLSVVGVLAGAFLGGDAGSATAISAAAASQAAMLNYSRADENDADQVGMGYLVAAGYNPYAMARAFAVLSQRQWLLGSSIPTYLSTHPNLADRVRETTTRADRLPEAQRNIKEDNTRFKRIQALVRARYSDPRPAIVQFNSELSGPNSCLAYMGLGIVAGRQNRVLDATSFFDKALECSAKDPLIVREAGRFHYTKGNNARGGSLLQQAVKLDRDDIMALFFLSRYQADTGQIQDAINNMQVVLRSAPEDAEVHQFLAKFHGKHNDLFSANLHMAYSHLYTNNASRTEQFVKHTKELASTPEQQTRLARLTRLHDERKEFWK